MKRIINTIIVLIIIAALTAAFASISGCSSGIAEFDEDVLPKAPSDRSVLSKWDEHTALDGVPRYNGGGIFDVLAEINENEVNVYYAMTSEEDYLGYNELLKKSGFKLEDGSSIWTNEGALGVPRYANEKAEVRLVWSSDGTLAVCVKRK